MKQLYLLLVICIFLAILNLYNYRDNSGVIELEDKISSKKILTPDEIWEQRFAKSSSQKNKLEDNYRPKSLTKDFDKKISSNYQINNGPILEAIPDELKALEAQMYPHLSDQEAEQSTSSAFEITDNSMEFPEPSENIIAVPDELKILEKISEPNQELTSAVSTFDTELNQNEVILEAIPEDLREVETYQ